MPQKCQSTVQHLHWLENRWVHTEWHDSGWQREQGEEEEGGCEERRGVPWQLFLTQTLERAHQRSQLTKTQRKEGRDANNKQMFMESRVHPTYLMAVCFLQCFLTGGAKDLSLLQVISGQNKVDRRCLEVTKKHTHTHTRWSKVETLKTHTPFFFTHFHFKAPACCSLLPHIHSQPSPTSSSCGRRRDFQAQRTLSEREVSR